MLVLMIQTSDALLHLLVLAMHMHLWSAASYASCLARCLLDTMLTFMFLPSDALLHLLIFVV